MFFHGSTLDPIYSIFPKCKQLIEEGAIGEIKLLVADFLFKAIMI